MTEKIYNGDKNLGNYAETEMGKGNKLFPSFDQILEGDMKKSPKKESTKKQEKSEKEEYAGISHSGELHMVGLGDYGNKQKKGKKDHPVLGTNK